MSDVHFTTREIGSLGKPSWLVKAFAGRPLVAHRRPAWVALLVGAYGALAVPGVARDEALVRIRGIQRRGITIGREFSYPEYRDYAAQQRLFEGPSHALIFTATSALMSDTRFRSRPGNSRTNSAKTRSASTSM